jgi:hypothetical protein
MSRSYFKTRYYCGPKPRPKKTPKGKQKMGKKIDALANKGGMKLYDQLGTDTKALKEILFPPSKLLIMNILT